MSEPEYRYRIRDCPVTLEADGLYYFSGVDVVVERFEVIKHTPCGVRIAKYPLDKKGRFILERWKGGSRGTRKRYAYPTIKEAAESYHVRKEKHVGHLMRELRNAVLSRKAARRLKTDQSELDDGRNVILERAIVEVEVSIRSASTDTSRDFFSLS